jgi:hypothetical protein
LNDVQPHLKFHPDDGGVLFVRGRFHSFDGLLAVCSRNLRTLYLHLL